jgi:uncharacterized membrane protein
MLKNLVRSIIIPVLLACGNLLADIEYEINDIGTLQTHSSQAIALNNDGQILGWYNIDGSSTGKHFFVRDRDGSFHDLPAKENGVGFDIDWRFLIDDGKAYGTFDGNANFAVLYMWDQHNGVVNLGALPGKEISAINNAGQVLIQSVLDNEYGVSIRRPVIWDNGKITKLKGLEGDVGIESEESYGYDMNNKGEVVGKSVVQISYKNKLYTETHAVKWVNGQAIDLHQKTQKSNISVAIAINDLDDVLIRVFTDKNNYVLYLLEGCDKAKNWGDGFGVPKINNCGYGLQKTIIVNRNRNVVTQIWVLNPKLLSDFDSIWMKVLEFISVNDNGEVIANGETIFGEKHAMFLTPVKPE